MFLQQHLLLQDLVYLREDHQIHPMHSPTLLPLPPFTTCYPTRPPASQLRTSESKPKTFRMHSPLTQHEIKMDCLLYEYMSMVLLCKIHQSTFSRKCLHQNVFLLSSLLWKQWWNNVFYGKPEWMGKIMLTNCIFLLFMTQSNLDGEIKPCSTLFSGGYFLSFINMPYYRHLLKKCNANVISYCL